MEAKLIYNKDYSLEFLPEPRSDGTASTVPFGSLVEIAQQQTRNSDPKNKKRKTTMDDDIVMVDEESIPLIISMVAGCVAGAIEATAAWPMEYIKVQLQLQQDRQQLKAAAAAASKSSATSDYYAADGGDGIWIEVLEKGDVKEVIVEEPPPYRGMIHGLVYTVRTHGFFALYTGLMPTLLGSIPKAGIRFFLFAWFSDLLRDRYGNLSIGMCLLAGLAAGAFEALIVVVPVETVKTKCIQLNMPFLQGLHKIIHMEGIPGIYQGVLATVLKQSSNHGLRFVWYYEYKRIVTHDGLYALSPAQAFMGGMTAGIFSAVGNQPFDVLKTRMQGLNLEEQHPHSTWDCIRKTFRRDGILGFYVGIVPRLFRVIPGQGIIFMSFECIVAILLAVSKKG